MVIFDLSEAGTKLSIYQIFIVIKYLYNEVYIKKNLYGFILDVVK